MSVGDNGYRQYGREEQLRLQQILFHRDMGMSLADIATMLDAPDFDRLAALRRQRDRVAAQAARHQRLLATIDRTIFELEGQAEMPNHDLFDGFEPKRQGEYEAYITDKYGSEGRQHIENGRRRMATMAPAELAAHMGELQVIETDLAKAVAAGIAADDPVLDPVLARHHEWVAAGWAASPTADAYVGLGELYAAHPDFVARYESTSLGLATFLRDAMKAFARRHLKGSQGSGETA